MTRVWKTGPKTAQEMTPKYTGTTLVEAILEETFERTGNNKKIEDQAKVFRSRAVKGALDLKRHDLIQPDEERAMWTAYSKLGWSFAKKR